MRFAPHTHQTRFGGLVVAAALGVSFAVFVAADCPARPAPRIPEISHLFVDFDGTIALSEAFETLAEAAYESNVDPDPAVPPWSYFSEAYNIDYEVFSATYPSRTNLSDELIYRSSSGLHAVESDSFDRVLQSNAMVNATLPILTKYASAIQLRAGFWPFVEASLSRELPVRVVSLNWSVGWIRLALREDLKKIAANETTSKVGREWIKKGLAEKVAIYCPEILPSGIIPQANVPGGRLFGVKLDNPTRLHTGGDKVDLMRAIIAADEEDEKKKKNGPGKPPKGGRKLARRGGPPPKNPGKKDKLVVFIGDSSNDLPPLVEAEVGIVAGEDSGTLGRLERYNVSVVELGESGYVGKSNELGLGKEGGIEVDFLYRLHSFEEVVDAFWGRKR